MIGYGIMMVGFGERRTNLEGHAPPACDRLPGGWVLDREYVIIGSIGKNSRATASIGTTNITSKRHLIVIKYDAAFTARFALGLTKGD